MIENAVPRPTPIIRRALLVALVAGAISLVGAVLDFDLFIRAYLVAWFYWVGFALGGLSLLLLHNLTGGAWGFAVRPWLTGAAATLPLMALLFLPIPLNLERLYPWANPDLVALDPILQHKEPYLNPIAFVGRTILYFAIWMLFWYFAERQFQRLLETGDARVGRNLRRVSGVGLALYSLSITFASVDWLMSLEPHWFSSIFGVMILVGQGLGALALAVVMSLALSRRAWDVPLPATSQLHDLGKLLLAFTMLWAYMAFSQYLIIWYGNLPEEVTWYLHRSERNWLWIGGALIVFHFAVPFLLLLARQTKRNPRWLLRIAWGLVLARWLDVWWLVEPAFPDTRLYFPWLDLAVTVALGGLWFAICGLSVPTGDVPLVRAVRQSKVVPHG